MFTILEEAHEKYYIKLESEYDSKVSAAQITSISVIENFSHGTPFLLLKFIDGMGDLINHTHMSPSAEYDLYLGVDQKSAKKSSFSISNIGYENMANGRPEYVAMDLTFITAMWPKLIKDTHSRSWSEKKYSDVVKELATEIGFISSDIEDTDKTFNIIQPDWTNLQLLRWLSKHSYSINGMGGYDFGVKIDGTFVFKTLDSFFNQKPIKELYLSNPTDKSDFFTTFDIKQRYMDLINQGAGGYDYMFFDYDKKEFIKGSRKISDSKQRQLSDWSYIATEHSEAKRRFFGGCDINTPNLAENRILDVSNSIQSLDISISGDINIHIGDIVNLIIPPSQYSKTIVNENYSGYWMVGKVNHNISVNDASFVSYLTLIRSGYDGKKLKGFEKTKTGKKIIK